MGLVCDKDGKSLTSIYIYTNKVCYCVEEYIQGIIYLQGSPGLKESYLRDSIGEIELVECEQIRYYDKDATNFKGEKGCYENEFNNNTIFSEDLIITKFKGQDLMKGIQIPFSIQIPNKNYLPTCYFDKNNRIKHTLKFRLPSVKAEGETQIVLKNGENYISGSTTVIKETDKHKLMHNEGTFTMSFNLDKKTFAYNEIIPLEVRIDCSKGNLKIKGITVSLIREVKKEYSTWKKKDEKEITSKVIKVEKGQEKYIITDSIKFPLETKYDPLYIYKNAEQMRNPKAIKDYILAPSCKGKLINVNYYIQVEVNFDSILTTNEKMRMEISFYVPYKKIEKNNNNAKIPNSNNINNGQNINIEEYKNKLLANYQFNQKKKNNIDKRPLY